MGGRDGTAERDRLDRRSNKSTQTVVRHQKTVQPHSGWKVVFLRGCFWIHLQITTIKYGENTYFLKTNDSG